MARDHGRDEVLDRAGPRRRIRRTPSRMTDFSSDWDEAWGLAEIPRDVEWDDAADRVAEETDDKEEWKAATRPSILEEQQNST